jgi:hypothetical protein
MNLIEMGINRFVETAAYAGTVGFTIANVVVEVVYHK